MNTGSLGAIYRHQETTSTDSEYEFVNPSQEFNCPVTKGVLLDPHQTLCCGNILSAEATTRIQGEGGACPLCNKESFKTYPDQNFRRRVSEQQVFCPNKNRGCVWKGELANVHSHENSCPRKNSPIQTHMAQLSQSP